MTYYFSDCQTGAATGCLPGSNSSAGTSASAPKQNLAGVNLNALPAGSRLLFARGGAWTNVNLSLRNLNATVANPLVFDAYAASWGSTALPKLMTSSANAVSFGTYSDTVSDGGYTFRNLKFDGQGTATWGFFLMGATRSVVVENNEITGFEIGVHSQNQGTGNQGFTLRGNNIHHNREMGILGDAHDYLIENNDISYNNTSGSGFNHGLYLGSHTDARNAIVRNNRFTNNSVVNGVCTGGNLTVHGLWTGLLIEGNTISQTQSTYGCWGISITDGYNEAEYFRNAIVRANQVINLESAIAIRGAPGVVVERNVIRSNQAQIPSGVTIVPPNGANDDAGVNPVVRDTVVCLQQGGGAAVRIAVSGGSETGTTLRTGANATTGACAQ